MIINQVHIKNFRALKDVVFFMSSFSCIIGENNCGKSSLMQAIKLFLKPTKLDVSDYYDPSRPVVISMKMSVDQDDFNSMADEEHRSRMAQVAEHGLLTLTMSFHPGETPKMTCTRKIPTDEKWLESNVSATLKGKSGATLKQTASEAYPEIQSALDSLTGNATIGKVKELIEAYCASLPAESLREDHLAPLPTGLDASVKSLLPDPIYIEAVKDISEDVKTTKEAVFGKLLGLLLNVIQPEAEMDQFRTALTELTAKLNKTVRENGQIEDHRFRQIVMLENSIEANLRDHFPDAKVEIQIPPPDLQKILQSASIDIHDGSISGNIETKGDGLKRSVLFSLFRAFVQLSEPQSWSNPDGGSIVHRHLILFEEPELYLHPKAQQVLFDSLNEVSKSFQVVVTTHSPLFFSARKTKTFAKLIKRPKVGAEVPHSDLIAVDLQSDLTVKDEFQILCYENNNVAFFANSVLLVEGDSDVAALKHLASTLNQEWDFDKGRIRMVKVGGKGNFARYISFFKRFKIDVMVLADLDALINDFDKLGLKSDSPCHQLRNNLLSRVTGLITGPVLTGDQVKETWKSRGGKLIQIVSKIESNTSLSTEDSQFLTDMKSDLGIDEAKEKILANEVGVKDEKLALLRSLRDEKILILSKGKLEDYYPPEVTGADKTAKADNFRSKVTTREAALALTYDVPASNGTHKNEFEAMFSSVFERDTTEIRS